MACLYVYVIKFRFRGVPNDFIHIPLAHELSSLVCWLLDSQYSAIMPAKRWESLIPNLIQFQAPKAHVLKLHSKTNDDSQFA